MHSKRLASLYLTRVAHFRNHFETTDIRLQQNLHSKLSSYLEENSLFQETRFGRSLITRKDVISESKGDPCSVCIAVRIDNQKGEITSAFN
ncbi:hypothetical protein TNCT_548121 [Trichonephila clavata]|uniref:Uncharacterized protein n=1 Tax=Trichonephila clavata TaxID=2740835 RepID=A0A8X6JMN6_TRICU|nr:hypothetical protein TNCT_548121 [Trichonephila clavata]